MWGGGWRRSLNVVLETGFSTPYPGSSNDQKILVVSVIDPVFRANARKSAQLTKRPQISTKRVQKTSKQPQKSDMRYAIWTCYRILLVNRLQTKYQETPAGVLLGPKGVCCCSTPRTLHRPRRRRGTVRDGISFAVRPWHNSQHFFETRSFWGIGGIGFKNSI